MNVRPLKRYIALIFCISAAFLLMAAGVTIIVDPYGLNHGSRWTGINAKKPRAYTHAVLAKTAAAVRAQPNAVILGNSRMDIGFDPKSPAWPDKAQPVFNLAVPGLGLSSDVEKVQEVFVDRTPRLAVIGVDFVDFLYDGRHSTQREPLKRSFSENLRKKIGQLTLTTLSISSLIDSVRTVAAQSDPNAADMTPLGFNPFRQYLDHVRREGHNAIFYQKNVENIRKFLREPKSVVGRNGQKSPDFDALIKLVRWCLERNVSVKLVIYPYHVDILEAFWKTGLWPVFEDWKRLLTHIVAVEKSRGQGHDTELWDFSGYHRYATETVPPQGDTRTHMQWYWEAGHFKAAMGEIMLRRMISNIGETGVGVRLTTKNVEQVIQRFRRDAVAYRKREPGAGARINKLVRRLSAPHAEF